MLCTVKAMLVMLITWHCVRPGVTLRTTFTTQPLLGYRCVTYNPSSQVTWLSTTRTQCVWRCLSSNSCVVISYNHRLNHCELSMQLCDKVVSDVDFSVNVYGMDRKLCLRWVPVTKYDAKKAIAFKQKAWKPKIAVARKHVNTGLYPGKHLRFAQFQIIVVVNESTEVADYHGEILLVDPDCYWKWVLYTSPNVLPVGAVKGGYDVNGESLYVARAKVNGYYSIGYYKPSQMRGYFGIYGHTETKKFMHILIILWCKL